MAALFACTKCHGRHSFDELSKEEQLCKTCRRKYPLVACIYCRLEFHILKRIQGEPVCAKCAANLTTYGPPKNCQYCHLKSAFKQKCCSRCVNSEKHYGLPVRCNQCKLRCAFNKKGESQAKVGGQILCLQCTLNYKKTQHERQKEQRKLKYNSEKKKQLEEYSKMASNFSATVTPIVAPLKAENLSMTFKSRIDSVERTSRQNSRSNSPAIQESNNESAQEVNLGDHISEMSKLREQIAVMKKIISQKEKTILEKDKKISEFQAEQWEKEKLIRQKIQAIHKDHNERHEQLQSENQSLRKQISALSKTRKTPKNNRVSCRIRIEPDKISERTSFGNKMSTFEDNTTDNEITPKTKDEDKNEVKEIDNNAAEIMKKTVEASDLLAEAKEVKRKSFDEVQEAQIKKILQPDADDEYTSSGIDETAANIQGKRKRKRKSKLAVEDEDEYTSSGMEEVHSAVKKKHKKKRRSKPYINDDDDDDVKLPEEKNNNVNKEESDEEMDSSLFQPTDGEEDALQEKTGMVEDAIQKCVDEEQNDDDDENQQSGIEDQRDACSPGSDELQIESDQEHDEPDEEMFSPGSDVEQNRQEDEAASGHEENEPDEELFCPDSDLEDKDNGEISSPVSDHDQKGQDEDAVSLASDDLHVNDDEDDDE